MSKIKRRRNFSDEELLERAEHDLLPPSGQEDVQRSIAMSLLVLARAAAEQTEIMKKRLERDQVG